MESAVKIRSDLYHLNVLKRREVMVLRENRGSVFHSRCGNPGVVATDTAAAGSLSGGDTGKATRDLGANRQKGVDGLHPGKGGESAGSSFWIGCAQHS